MSEARLRKASRMIRLTSLMMGASASVTSSSPSSLGVPLEGPVMVPSVASCRMVAMVEAEAG